MLLASVLHCLPKNEPDGYMSALSPQGKQGLLYDWSHDQCAVICYSYGCCLSLCAISLYVVFVYLVGSSNRLWTLCLLAIYCWCTLLLCCGPSACCWSTCMFCCVSMLCTLSLSLYLCIPCNHLCSVCLCRGVNLCLCCVYLFLLCLCCVSVLTALPVQGVVCLSCARSVWVAWVCVYAVSLCVCTSLLCLCQL